MLNVIMKWKVSIFMKNQINEKLFLVKMNRYRLRYLVYVEYDKVTQFRYLNVKFAILNCDIRYSWHTSSNYFFIDLTQIRFIHIFFFFANLNLSKIVFYARVCLRNTSLNGAAHMHWIIIFLVRTAIVIDDFFFWVKCWLVGWFHSSAFSRYVYTVVYENWLRRDGGTQMLLV